jgi:hypothetical protein
MRNMLALFAAVLLTVVGLGWYLDWYKVRSQPASVPGQHSLNIDINTNKIGTDLQKGEQKIQQMLENKTKDETQKAAPDAKKTPDSLMLPTPGSAPQLNLQMNKGSSLQFNTSDKGPLLRFQSDKGPSLQIGNGERGPLIQIETGDKGPTIKFEGDEKKPNTF